MPNALQRHSWLFRLPELALDLASHSEIAIHLRLAPLGLGRYGCAPLRIAFLTTCLQPARDGVGDYTSGLAAECAGLGHERLCMALNDPYSEEWIRGQDPIRFSSSSSWAERVSGARECLDQFAPDVISLQFVCYGFHPRGIDFQLANRLKAICGDIPVQITFHELWIGSQLGAGWKERLVGALQRQGVLSVVKKLRPVLVHTTNPAYQALLKQNGVSSRRLPLFGSVPIIAEGAGRLGVPVRSETDWHFGMFGSLHPIWPPEPLLKQLIATGKKIRLSHVGNIGPGKALWEQMKREFADRIEFERLGELPTERLSEFFGRIDFGIATTPWEMIGKSASVAAMLEHGLPVIVNRDDIHYRGWIQEGYSPLLIKMGDRLGEQLEQARRQSPQSVRGKVAEQFLADLKGAL